MTKKSNGDAKRTSTSGLSGVVLVTGASGFLGKQLVEQLVAAGTTVRALVRHRTLHLERLGCEVIAGDVCDAEACRRAVEGASAVFHAAGLVSRDPDDGPRMYRVHVDGTRLMLNAAADAGVRRVVVVSSSGTVAVSDKDEVSNEESPYRHSVVANWPYYLSKIYQEQTAFALARERQLEVVVVGPSLLLGPGDERGSSTGDVDKVVRGLLPIVPKGGGVAFVDVRDAAAGCLLAMQAGRAGERYLLSAANMPIETFLGRVARLAGKPAPRAVSAPRSMLAAGRLIESLSRLFDVRPPIEVQSVEMAQRTWYVDATKAERELKWTCRDPQVTLADTVRDLQARRNITGRDAHASV